MDPLADTAEMYVSDDFENMGDKYFGPGVAQTRLSFGALSHVGKVRKKNEDHYGVVRRHRSRDVLFTNLPEGFLPPSCDQAHTMVVADGIGGIAFGELASMLALRTGWDLTTKAINWPFQINDREADKVLEQLSVYGKKMHKALRESGRAAPERFGMGTTITAILLIGTDAFIAHVGDSRAYLMRNRRLQRLRTTTRKPSSAWMPACSPQCRKRRASCGTCWSIVWVDTARTCAWKRCIFRLFMATNYCCARTACPTWSMTPRSPRS